MLELNCLTWKPLKAQLCAMLKYFKEIVLKKKSRVGQCHAACYMIRLTGHPLTHKN